MSMSVYAFARVLVCLHAFALGVVNALQYHREQLSAKKSERKGGLAGGGYEERLRHEAVASGRCCAWMVCVVG